MSVRNVGVSFRCIKTGASSLPKRERNDMKALRSSGQKKAAPVLGTRQGANGNPSELFVVHVHDLPGGLTARLLGGLLLYLQFLASAWAAIAEDHRLGGLSNTHLYFSVPEAGKSKVLADSVLSEGPLPGWQSAHSLMCLPMVGSLLFFWPCCMACGIFVP